MRKVDLLLAETRSNDGLAPVDLERFWADQDRSIKDPFGADIPQLPLGALLTDECVFAELGIEEDYYRYQHDKPWALSLNRKYNDIAERIVGRRLLRETCPDPRLAYPATMGLHDVFGARRVWHGGASGSWWLEQAAQTPRDLEALLDRVDAVNVHDFILPDNWHQEKTRLLAAGVKPPLYRQQRGPCTFACSIFGAENTLLLCMDQPELARRFSATILRVILEIARVLDEEAGYSPQDAPGRWAWADDNCCLFSPELYEMFGYPIVKAVFERYCPNAADTRYQHSDSPMGHLLGLMSKLDFNRVNFGPTLTVDQIRRHLPRAVIQGQLAPFTYSRNEHANILAELLRDFEQAAEHRGLVFTTAGSINNGTRLTSMRLLMAGIQRYCRFDRASIG